MKKSAPKTAPKSRLARFKSRNPKASKSKSSKASKSKAVPQVKTNKLVETNWRVLRLAEPTREAFTAFRDAHDLTNADCIDLLVSQQLPEIIETLKGLGCSKQKGNQRPMRLPFSDESLLALRLAANETGIPAALLFRCLIGQTNGKAK